MTRLVSVVGGGPYQSRHVYRPRERPSYVWQEAPLLRKILVTLVTATAFGAAAVIPAASAHAARSAKQGGTCPPGSSGGSYCEECIVPALEGDSVLQAQAALVAADCKLGLVYLAKSGHRKAVKLTPKLAPLFTVVAQIPAAGAVRPAGWPVSIGVVLAR